MPRRIDTLEDLAEGLNCIERLEPRFGAMRAAAGEVPLRRSEAGFAGLARIIVGQQVSIAAAGSIWARLRSAFPDLTPAAIEQADAAALRACGLSASKIRTFHALAEAIGAGRLDLAALNEASPDIVRTHLTSVAGIGPWTADIYLMFNLGHGDVFAPGDLALQEATRLGLALPARPDQRTLATIAQAWSPWRAAAARLLWAYYAHAKRRDSLPT